MQNFELLMTRLGEGMVTTIWIFAVTLLLALPFGMIVGFRAYVEKRNHPQHREGLHFYYEGNSSDAPAAGGYFGPYFIFGMRLTPNSQNLAVIIGFTLNYAAYFAEIYRSGIESMPAGQYEARRCWATQSPRPFSISSCPR